MAEGFADSTSRREEFAQRLRQLLDQGRLTQATLARRLRQHGIAREPLEPRVSDWVHGRYLPREETVVFAIESILAQAGVDTSEEHLVARTAGSPPRTKAITGHDLQSREHSKADAPKGMWGRMLAHRESRSHQLASRPSGHQRLSLRRWQRRAQGQRRR